MNKSVKMFLVVGILLYMMPTAQAASYEVIRWFDSFESHDCNDYLENLMYPEIPGNLGSSANMWTVGGNDDIYTTIDCTKASGGTHSVVQAWNGSDYIDKGSAITGYPQFYTNAAQILVRPGCTTVMEMDAYFNYDILNYRNDGEGCATLDWHGSGLPMAGWYVFVDGGPGSKVRYLQGPGFSNFIDSNMPMLTGNVWYHFRTEVYDDFTYSVFITAPGGSAQTMISHAPCANAPVAGFYSVGYVDYLELRLTMAKGIINWDNVKVSYIDNAAQGFRDIYPLPSGVAIDGVLGASEWTKATKVASKPLGSNGVFAPTTTHANVVMDVNQYVDVYAAYDSSNYYIAAQFNKTVINAGTYAGSYFEAILADDPNGLVYVFGCCAKATSGTSGQLKKFVGKQNMPEYTSYDPCMPGLSYSAFTGAGGQIVYTVSGDVMNVEMKIPFTQLAGFAPFGAGKKVNLQFNVTGTVYGCKQELTPPEQGLLIACTTNIGFERYPWQASNADIGTPFGAGIAYPACGDADNAYPVGDLNQDCKVNFKDLAMMTASWLNCNAVSCN